MELGIIGLGRMGQIVVDRTLAAGHDAVAYDIDDEAVAAAADAGARPADSIPDLADTLGDEKRIWLMVPAGDPTGNSIAMISSSMPATHTTAIRCAGQRRPRRRISTVGPAAGLPALTLAFR
jgi:6-phosphogluconate dehydrogenase (decarboxylating)